MPAFRGVVSYRMHPAISAFPNKQFYNRKLKNGDNVLKENLLIRRTHLDLMLSLILVTVQKYMRVPARKSSLSETELVLHLVTRVHDSGDST